MSGPASNSHVAVLPSRFWLDGQPSDPEGQMNWRSQPDDTVTVHVTPRGGLYVKPEELLRSKAARAMIAKMDRVLRADRPTPHGGSNPQCLSR